MRDLPVLFRGWGRTQSDCFSHLAASILALQTNVGGRDLQTWVGGACLLFTAM